MTDWRPMSEFDPDKPALVHDRLNDQVINWLPEQNGKDWHLAGITTSATASSRVDQPAGSHRACTGG